MHPSHTEKGLWSDIRKKVKGPHWVRVESNMTAQGVADCNGCLGGVEVWVELKVTKTNRLTIRPRQVVWLRERWYRGGRSFLLARHIPTKTLHLIAGQYIDDAKKLGLGSPHMIRVEDWRHLRTLLFHKSRDSYER